MANLPEQQNRIFYSLISFVPSIRLDGPHPPAQNNPTGYENLYQQRKAIPARARIELAGAYDFGTRSGQVTARVIADQGLPGDWRLRIALRGRGAERHRRRARCRRARCRRAAPLVRRPRSS